LLRKDLASGRIDTFAPSGILAHGGFRPRFSPDGSSLAFLAIDGNRLGMVVAAVDGSSAHEVPAPGREVSDLDWAADGRSLVVGSEHGIEIIGLDGSLERVLYRTSDVGLISVAAQAPVLAYSRGRRERNIWAWKRPSADGDEGEAVRVIHTTAWDASPALSPDGRLIAFLSNRGGRRQLWLASRDGGGARQLTDLDLVLPVPPAWSPDGSRLVIVVEVDARATLCVVEVASRRTTLLQPPETGESRPVWSRDGATLLVSRSTADGSEIWRRPAMNGSAEGDSAALLIEGGGYRAAEARDGSALFFTRTLTAGEIWQSDPDGSNPRLVVSLPAGEIMTWQVTEAGLVYGYRNQIAERFYRIASHDLSSYETTELLTIPGRLGFDLDVDPVDHSTIVFDQTELLDSDIMALTGF
jgi:Tol biopolymer transport system component